MNIQDKLNQAFRNIQSDPTLWRAWNDCLTQGDRDAMLSEALWNLAYSEALADSKKNSLTDRVVQLKKSFGVE